ncbi:hypothetical protein CF319_g6407 [Tilletia indica]|uniref:Uncharacterized protein n=1 Tax=Tilletia indica TaxID=43049 RepID=A0A177TEF9_9BASI|nr:hypothetical protein CF319_g6407 [Tilletia indica]KAE8241348.1 hypothetical protein A4X13_0g7454 [Tilletia indica]
MSTNSRPIKFTTHLSISSDLIITDTAAMEDNIQHLQTHILNFKGPSIESTLSLWGRDVQPPGAYILTQQPFATNPARIYINETSCLRQIPEEFDGSVAENPSLPAGPVFLSGNGVLVHVEGNKKSGRIIGKVFFSKNAGWIDYGIEVEFEDTLRFNAWLLPPPRTVVNFDAILNCVDEDGTVRVFLRRIVAVEPASASLLAALKNEKATVNDRASLILEARNKRIKFNQATETKSQDEATFIETPSKEATSTAIVPTAPKKSGIIVNSETPPSPSPAPTRKRGRAE